MPDLDIIPRTAVPGWKAVSRLLAGNAADDEIGKEILHSLGQSLREGGGLPCLDALATIATDFRRQNLTYSEAMAKVAERAAGYVLAEIEDGEHDSPDLRQVVAERFLSCLTDHCVVDRRRPELVGTKYASYGDAFAAEERYKSGLRSKLSQLANRLVQDPTAAHLRAPAMVVGSQRTTTEWLGVDLSSL